MEPELNEGESFKQRIDPIDVYVGKRLKMRRIMLGLSQHDLGDAVNVSIQQIQKYEKAANRISSGRLFAFAKLLMVPLDYFFQDIETQVGAVQDERENFEANDTASEKELIMLIRAFGEIKDGILRKKIVDLIRALADRDA